MSNIDSIDSAGTASLAFLEELFEQFQNDPASVPAEWRGYFDARQAGRSLPVATGGDGHAAVRPSVNGNGAGPAPSPLLVTPDGIAEVAPGVVVHVSPGTHHATEADGPEPLELVCIFSPTVVSGSYEKGGAS